MNTKRSVTPVSPSFMIHDSSLIWYRGWFVSRHCTTYPMECLKIFFFICLFQCCKFLKKVITHCTNFLISPGLSHMHILFKKTAGARMGRCHQSLAIMFVAVASSPALELQAFSLSRRKKLHTALTQKLHTNFKKLHTNTRVRTNDVALSCFLIVH